MLKSQQLVDHQHHFITMIMIIDFLIVILIVYTRMFAEKLFPHPLTLFFHWSKYSVCINSWWWLHEVVTHFYFLQAKQRCEVLEEQLVDLVVLAMERSENESVNDDTGLSQLLWQHLSSQLIYFVLFQFASFPHMVLSLYEKVNKKKLTYVLWYEFKVKNWHMSEHLFVIEGLFTGILFGLYGCYIFIRLLISTC